jgi:DNA-binding transcriptional regulator YiaG
MESDFGGLCCIKGCDLKVLAVGLCNKHWRRNKRFGSPVLVNRTSGFFIGKTAEERYFAQVIKADGCWVWRSSKDKDGYGIFNGAVQGVVYKRAHRFSWAFHNQMPIPDGMLVCHSCDNPECSNPEHLTLGTQQDNQREKWRKGRANHQSPAAKLTEDQVRQIRQATGRQADIAAAFGITQTTVSDIKRRRSWSHID